MKLNLSLRMIFSALVLVTSPAAFSSDKAHFIMIHASSCDRAEAAQAKIEELDCERVCFVPTWSHQNPIKCIYEVASDLRYHTIAILIGLGDVANEVQEATNIIKSNDTLAAIDAGLTHLIPKACEYGQFSVSYHRYVSILEAQLGCSKLPKTK